MSDTSSPVIKLPIVDMSKTKTDRAGLAKIVVDALENIGFLFIDNVEGLDFDRLFQACQWFFSLPPEKKRKLCRKNWVPENPNIYRGYFPVVEGEPSRKEGFEFGRAVRPDDVQVLGIKSLEFVGAEFSWISWVCLSTNKQPHQFMKHIQKLFLNQANPRNCIPTKF